MAYIPRGATGHETWGTLIEAAPIMQYIFDRPFQFFPFIPGGCHFTATALKGQGAGTADFAEINTAEVGGLTTNANNESASFIWYIPVDCDTNQAITLAHLWSNSQSATTGSGQISTKYTAVIVGTTAIAVGATTTGVTSGATAVDLAANIPKWSTDTEVAADTFTTLTPGDDCVIWMNYVTYTTITDMTLYCTRLRYYRKYLG